MLFFFVHHNMLLGLEYLLKNSLVDINEKNYNGHTALVVAIKECKIESIKFLLKNGAKMNSRTETISLLRHAIINGNLECLKALLNNDGVIGNIDDFLVLINCATMNGNTMPLR
jgi:ankyrin repeat protein